MRYFFLFFVLVFCSACSTDYGKVVSCYENGNPIAKELLFAGYNSKMEEIVDSDFLDEALKGNEQSKQIVLAQIKCLNVTSESRSRSTPVYIPIPQPIMIPR